MGRKDEPYTKSICDYIANFDVELQAEWEDGIGSKIPEEAFSWEGDYIFCFRSRFILPERLLKKASVCAINFHPASPNYRGSGCNNFALYNGETEYGCTAHILAKEIDTGHILDVRRFSIHDHDDIQSLMARTYNYMQVQAFEVIEKLFENGQLALDQMIKDCAHESWSGRLGKMKELDALSIIQPDISEKEFKRVYRATKFGKFGPVIYLHNKKFILDE